MDGWIDDGDDDDFDDDGCHDGDGNGDGREGCHGGGDDDGGGDGNGEGDGDCKEGGNWIQPKCNDFCWEIDEEVNERKFDYLIDIGVCNTSIIVQRSEWLEKDELDFLLEDFYLINFVQ